jgi:EAL and modified HD-GYP domain-containing signal transduction protein
LAFGAATLKCSGRRPITIGVADPSLARSSQGPRLHSSADDHPPGAVAFVGRQPIFDRSLAVFGYELLYRRGLEGTAVFTDGDSASAEIALNAFLEFGLDTLVADRPAFINLTRSVLLSGVCRQLPPDRVVLELLEDLPCDDEVAREVEALAAAGYSVALDDFVVDDPRADLLPFASIVKIDIEALSAEQLRALVTQLSAHPVHLVAERVETQEQLAACRALGVHYFQGYFFARPTVLQGRRVPVERLSALRVLALLADPDTPLHVLARAIAGDVRLSYQVLRAANSAFSAPASAIESIPSAILRLGRDQLRAWLSIMALSGLEGKPRAVLQLALTRARMCEALGQAAGASSPGTWFMAGLFSTLDILFNAPLAPLLGTLPLSPAVVDAIANRTGPLGQTIDAIVAFEQGQWSDAHCGRLTPSDFTTAFRVALDWMREWESGTAGA